MPRYKLTVEYDGRPFAGWQRQEGQPTVQGVLERATEALNGEPASIMGAGRTDSGVHATGQVAHLDLRKAIRPDKVADALNYYMRPEPVAVVAAELVEDTFHARFSATTRRYLYRIVNRRADLTIDLGRAWRVAAPLDADLMQVSAERLLGTHDFTTFRDAQCQAKSPVKTLDWIEVRREGVEVIVRCAARSFLHRQVRSIVGSLVEVGRGKYPPEWMSDILEARQREACGPVAPPDGLYLTDVVYPEK